MRYCDAADRARTRIVIARIDPTAVVIFDDAAIVNPNVAQQAPPRLSRLPLLVRSGTDRRGLLGRDPWVRPRRLAVVGGEDNEVAIGIT